MFFIVRFPIGTIGSKEWWNTKTQEWVGNILNATAFKDINECVNVLKELQHDTGDVCYIRVK